MKTKKMFKYGKFENDGLYDVKFTHRTLDEEELSRPHYHDAVEFNIILKGELGCVVNGIKYNADQGQIFCFYNMETHYFMGKKGSEILCVIVNGKMLGDFYELYKNSFGEPCLPILMDNLQCNAKVIDFLCEWERNFDSKDWLGNKGRVNIVFSMLQQSYDLRYIKKGRDKIHAVDIFNFMNDNYKQNITLQVIADKFGYSRASISRIFHEYYGQDIRNYLNLLRVEKVLQMKEEDPKRTNTGCAYACGFKNMNSFYRAYKDRVNNGR